MSVFRYTRARCRRWNKHRKEASKQVIVVVMSYPVRERSPITLVLSFLDHRCKFNGGQYANPRGEISPDLDPRSEPPTREFPLWDAGSGGYIENCEFPLKLADGNGGVQV